jgi:hypothetical protein
MPYPRPYRSGPVQPIVEVGQQVLLLDRQSYNLYEVAFIEPLPFSNPLVINGNALANPGAPATPIAPAAVTATLSTQAVLDSQYGQFAQLRAKVLDDTVVTIYEPQAQARYTIKNINAVVSAFNGVEDPDGHTTEFYIFEDQRIFLAFRNPTGYAMTVSRVAFWGYKYVLSGPEGPGSSGGRIPPLRRFATINEAVKSGERFTVVPVGGWAQ